MSRAYPGPLRLAVWCPLLIARGGHARVEGTRIGAHDVVSYFLLGSNMDEVVARFPELSRAQIYECLAYYEDHRTKIEALAFGPVAARL